jgi:hypothetical protein
MRAIFDFIGVRLHSRGSFPNQRSETGVQETFDWLRGCC